MSSDVLLTSQRCDDAGVLPPLLQPPLLNLWIEFEQLVIIKISIAPFNDGSNPSKIIQATYAQGP